MKPSNERFVIWRKLTLIRHIRTHNHWFVIKYANSFFRFCESCYYINDNKEQIYVRTVTWLVVTNCSMKAKRGLIEGLFTVILTVQTTRCDRCGNTWTVLASYGVCKQWLLAAQLSIVKSTHSVRDSFSATTTFKCSTRYVLNEQKNLINT